MLFLLLLILSLSANLCCSILKIRWLCLACYQVMQLMPYLAMSVRSLASTMNWWSTCQQRTLEKPSFCSARSLSCIQHMPTIMNMHWHLLWFVIQPRCSSSFVRLCILSVSTLMLLVGQQEVSEW